jgi:hypothetical protein
MIEFKDSPTCIAIPEVDESIQKALNSDHEAKRYNNMTLNHW